MKIIRTSSLAVCLGALICLVPEARAVLADLTTSNVATIDTLYGKAVFQTDPAKTSGIGYLPNKVGEFLALDNSPTEHGYNTVHSPLPMDSVSTGNNYYKSLTVSELNKNQIAYNGVVYYQFILEIDQEIKTGNYGLISLDAIKIYTSAANNHYVTNASQLGLLGDLRFDLDIGVTGATVDSWVKYREPTTGGLVGDIECFIPATAFLTDDYAGNGLDAANPNDYVYFYARLGDNYAVHCHEEFWTAKGLCIPEAEAMLPLAGLFFGIACSRTARLRRKATVS